MLISARNSDDDIVLMADFERKVVRTTDGNEIGFDTFLDFAAFIKEHTDEQLRGTN